MRTDREIFIHRFIDNIMTQEEYEYNKQHEINKYIKTYSKELDKYDYIETIDDYNKIKLGGYIRYINFNGELKWGGFLIKKDINISNNFNIMTIANSHKQYIKVSFQNNHIFYKPHTTSTDKLKDIFISYLDKYDKDS